MSSSRLTSPAAPSSQTYFDRTAAAAWRPAHLGRAGQRHPRHRARRAATGCAPPCSPWLPEDLVRNPRVLDAGLRHRRARGRGGKSAAPEVTAIDLSPTLVGLGARTGPCPARASNSSVGDMADPGARPLRPHRRHGQPDPLPRPRYGARPWPALAGTHAIGSLLFTFAPRTPLLTAMHAAGRLFPRSDRAPSIEPVGPAHIQRRPGRGRAAHSAAPSGSPSGFYISQALEVLRP